MKAKLTLSDGYDITVSGTVNISEGDFKIMQVKAIINEEFKKLEITRMPFEFKVISISKLKKGVKPCQQNNRQQKRKTGPGRAKNQ